MMEGLQIFPTTINLDSVHKMFHHIRTCNISDSFHQTSAAKCHISPRRLPGADESGSTYPHGKTLWQNLFHQTRILLVLIPPPSPSSIDDCDLDLNFTFWDEEKPCFKPIGTAELDTLVNTLIARYPPFS
jgi:hypothetical protein